MKRGTLYILNKLIDEKVKSYENSIYSLNVSGVKGYENLVSRHQKKIGELIKAKNDLHENAIASIKGE